MEPRSAVPRFVASSTIDDEPWEAGAEAGGLPDRVRELACIGLVRFAEMLDRGPEASDVLSRGTPPVEARMRSPAVFRGDGVPGLAAVALPPSEP